MKKLIAMAIASTFTFGAAATFAAPYVKEQVRVEHRVNGRAPVKIEKVRYVNHHRHHRHVMRHHHRHF